MLVIKFKKNIQFLESSKILILLCWSCCTKDKICKSLLWKYNMLLKKRASPPILKLYMLLVNMQMYHATLPSRNNTVDFLKYCFFGLFPCTQQHKNYISNNSKLLITDLNGGIFMWWYFIYPFQISRFLVTKDICWWKL